MFYECLGTFLMRKKFTSFWNSHLEESSTKYEISFAFYFEELQKARRFDEKRSAAYVQQLAEALKVFPTRPLLTIVLP
jgi:hypothetical protein